MFIDSMLELSIFYQAGFRSFFEVCGFASTRAMKSGGFFLSSINLINSCCSICVRMSIFVYQKFLIFAVASFNFVYFKNILFSIEGNQQGSVYILNGFSTESDRFQNLFILQIDT